LYQAAWKLFHKARDEIGNPIWTSIEDLNLDRTPPGIFLRLVFSEEGDRRIRTDKKDTIIIDGDSPFLTKEFRKFLEKKSTKKEVNKYIQQNEVFNRDYKLYLNRHSGQGRLRPKEWKALKDHLLEHYEPARIGPGNLMFVYARRETPRERQE